VGCERQKQRCIRLSVLDDASCFDDFDGVMGDVFTDFDFCYTPNFEGNNGGGVLNAMYFNTCRPLPVSAV